MLRMQGKKMMSYYRISELVHLTEKIKVSTLHYSLLDSFGILDIHHKSERKSISKIIL